MDSTTEEMLRSHLAMAERHVARGWELIERHHILVSSLSARGLDLTQANDVMRVLLDTQKLHEQHRLRLMRELGLRPAFLDNARHCGEKSRSTLNAGTMLP
jgi:hypothetical protein